MLKSTPPSECQNHVLKPCASLYLSVCTYLISPEAELPPLERAWESCQDKVLYQPRLLQSDRQATQQGNEEFVALPNTGLFLSTVAISALEAQRRQILTMSLRSLTSLTDFIAALRENSFSSFFSHCLIFQLFSSYRLTKLQMLCFTNTARVK